MKKLLFVVLLFASFAAAQTTVGPLNLTSTGRVSIGAQAQGVVAINVSGTWSGTIQPQGSIQGQAAFNMQVTPAASTTPQSTITANGAYVVSVSGLSTFFLTGNTVTGTAVVYMSSSPAEFNPPGVTGGGSTSGMVITSAGTPAPSPLATAVCPTGQGVNMYGLKADGNYQDLRSWDNTTTGTGGGTDTEGAVNWCWKSYFNNTGAAIAQMKNRFIGIYFAPGLGGTQDSATQQGSAIGVRWDNEVGVGTSQSYQQENTVYGEFIIGGTPTFAGGAGGEVDWGGYRMSARDDRTGGTQTSRMYAYSAQMTRNTTADMVASGGTYGGYRAYMMNAATGALASNGAFIGFRAEGTSSAACSGTGCKFIGFQANLPSPRFATSNWGIQLGDFGTNASDYGLAVLGVNSAGTPSGFNALIGPTVLGNLAHAASGYQLDITGAIKVKAAAGVRQLDLFGSTSGSCGFSTDATSTVTTDTCPFNATRFQTGTNCAASGTAANPSVVSCVGAAAGAVYCDVAASAGTCTVNTTAVTANSRIFITLNTADGTELSKTCNAAPSVVPAEFYASKVAGTSFTINMPTITTNGACFEYFIVN